ncbi:60S ribosomal protein L44 [Trachymyrmex septentrionalis]|uniref:60S ribosomal protein L44 n=1 Tax=Trachymyrmex septentrionalis TaxID=34720 RepID=A0A195FWW0_9HYME|nr:60S ribosomal protein L44 [Trachymyrmex septentrionalis]
MESAAPKKCRPARRSSHYAVPSLGGAGYSGLHGARFIRIPVTEYERHKIKTSSNAMSGKNREYGRNRLMEDEGFESSWPERDVRFEATSLDSNKPWRCESFYVGFERISRSREIDRHPIRTCKRPQMTATRSSEEWTVNVPKQRRTFCKKCKVHKNHKVTQYKKSKERHASQGRRRYDRKQQGFGGQTKPIFRKKAKTTKKIVLRMECTECKYRKQIPLKRCKHFELGGDKKRKVNISTSGKYSNKNETCINSD